MSHASRPASEESTHKCRAPEEIASNDPEVLRAALVRESGERRQAECRASIQAEVVQIALDLLVREPDIEGFFGALTRTMVEQGESHTCAVWLIDEHEERCALWMAYLQDRLVMPSDLHAGRCGSDVPSKDGLYPCDAMAAHLFAYGPGWRETVEYGGEDARLPELVLEARRARGWHTTITTPMVLGGKSLGWITLSSPATTEPDGQWWRIVLIEAIARQAALALHHSRLIERHRLEERGKAILEERNRLARDIHDNLAQGFAAILMQLQAAQREAALLPVSLSSKLDTAVELARTHLTEARRSVGALRPNVGDGENLGRAIQRMAGLAQRTTAVPIDVKVDELPRLGEGVEREVASIAQEALTNAVRHARAQRITIAASTVRSIGLRLSIADDGRGIARDRSTAGFGLTSMQERADRIGASLTIVTAPRSGTEVVLAWEPSSMPTQVHVAG